MPRTDPLPGGTGRPGSTLPGLILAGAVSAGLTLIGVTVGLGLGYAASFVLAPAVINLAIQMGFTAFIGWLQVAVVIAPAILVGAIGGLIGWKGVRAIGKRADGR